MQSLFINLLHALNSCYAITGCRIFFALWSSYSLQLIWLCIEDSANYRILKWIGFFPMQKKSDTVIYFYFFYFSCERIFSEESSAIPCNHIRQSQNANLEIVYIEMMITRSFYLSKENFICCTGRTYRIGRTILMRAYGLRIRDIRIHTKRKLFCCENVSLREK